MTGARYQIAETLALRRTVFLDGERRPDDYEVRYKGQTVGRIYRMRSTGRKFEPRSAGAATIAGAFVITWEAIEGPLAERLCPWPSARRMGNVVRSDGVPGNRQQLY
jgi:hypothetical protein